jgi:hypothetical protein
LFSAFFPTIFNGFEIIVKFFVFDIHVSFGEKNCLLCSYQHFIETEKAGTSVADPDAGTGALLTPGYGIGK